MGFLDDDGDAFLQTYNDNTPSRGLHEMSTPDWAAFTTLTPVETLKGKPRSGPLKEHNPFEASFSAGTSAGPFPAYADQDEPTPTLSHDGDESIRSNKRACSPSVDSSENAKRPRMSMVQPFDQSSESPASSAVRTPSSHDMPLPLPIIHEQHNDQLPAFSFDLDVSAASKAAKSVPRYLGHDSQESYPYSSQSSSTNLSHLISSFSAYEPPASAHVQATPVPISSLPVPAPIISAAPPLNLAPAIATPLIASPAPAANVFRRSTSSASEAPRLIEPPKIKTRAKPGPKKGSTRKPKNKPAPPTAEEVAEGAPVEGEEDEEEKRKQFLERNRVAACKSRQKKKEWIGSLEQHANDLAAQNTELQALVAALREEVVQLRSKLGGAHQSCSSSGDHLAQQPQALPSAPIQAPSVMPPAASQAPGNVVPTVLQQPHSATLQEPPQRQQRALSLAMTSLPGFSIPAPVSEAHKSVIDVPPRPSSAPSSTPSYQDSRFQQDYFSQLTGNNPSQPLTTPDLAAQLGLMV